MKEGHEDALEMDWSEKAGRQWATELAAWSLWDYCDSTKDDWN